MGIRRSLLLSLVMLFSGCAFVEQDGAAFQVFASELPIIKGECKTYRDVEYFHMRDFLVCEDLASLQAYVIAYNGPATAAPEIGRAWNISLNPSSEGPDRFNWSKMIIGVRREDGTYCMAPRGKIPRPEIYTDKEGNDEGIMFRLKGTGCKELRFRHPWYKSSRTPVPRNWHGRFHG